MNVKHYLTFKAPEVYEHSVAANVGRFSDIPKVCAAFAEYKVLVVFGAKAKALAYRAACHDLFVAVAGLYRVFAGLLYPARSAFVLVVVKDHGGFVSDAVGVGEYVFVYAAVVPNVVEKEVFDLGKEPALFHQREYQLPVAVYQAFVGLFVAVGARVFHSVFFFKAFDLAVAEHRKAWHRYHQRADAKVLVALSELRHGGFLVGVVHKVDVAL